MKTIIFDELKNYVNDQVIRYDVPGHKGNNKILKEFTDFFGDKIIEADVNSMKRLDNLNEANSIIKQSQKNIAQVFGAEDSRILINGTTSGIQSMIMATIKPNETILVPRNCHKSITSALILSGANVVYATVEFSLELGVFTYVTLEEIKNKIEEYPEIKTVLLINPSYYGFCKEFKEIVSYCKEKEKIVIVDEAHGGQFYFTNDQYSTAINCGADITCISTHKTLGSLTQSSLLLFNSNKIKIDQVDFYYKMLNTTSPSYLLISSVEVAISNLKKNGYIKFSQLNKLVLKYKKLINDIVGFQIIDSEYFGEKPNEYDFSKILISTKNININGFELYDLLRDEYNIQVELAEFELVLCIIGYGDEENNLKKLYLALKDISSKNKYKESNEIKYNSPPQIKSKLNLREIHYLNKEEIDLDKAHNKICGESIMIYPPGIDIIKMGEVFTLEIIEYIKSILRYDVPVLGINNNLVKVI